MVLSCSSLDYTLMAKDYMILTLILVLIIIIMVCYSAPGHDVMYRIRKSTLVVVVVIVVVVMLSNIFVHALD